MEPNGQARVVVAFDGSACARSAARWAAAEAAARDCPLELVNAFTWPLPALSVIAPQVSEECGRRAAARHLGEGARLCRDVAPGLPVETGLLYGDPAEVLTKAAAGASVLVFGASGQSGTSQVMLGSVSAELARRAGCSVVVVRGAGCDTAPSASTGPVVVGVDGAPGTAEVARFGFDAAARLHREVVLVHSWSDLPIPALSALLGTAVDRARAEVASRLFLTELAEGPTREPYREVAVRHIAAVDRPAAALLHHAAGASLLVVGRHGRAGSREPLGSVSHAVLHYAPCPVAIVAPSAATTR
jgi:nucleotide-binding universal stress UspA family protein